jgi:hypothetical protein
VRGRTFVAVVAEWNWLASLGSRPGVGVWLRLSLFSSSVTDGGFLVREKGRRE